MINKCFGESIIVWSWCLILTQKSNYLLTASVLLNVLFGWCYVEVSGGRSMRKASGKWGSSQSLSRAAGSRGSTNSLTGGMLNCIITINSLYYILVFPW